MAGREEPDPGSSRVGHQYQGIHIHDRAHLGDNINNTYIENGVVINSKVAAESEYTGHYSFSSFGRPVSTYVNRPTLHNRIKEQLHDRTEEAASSTKILVVWGLGGAGKSQLVLNYLQEYRNDYSATFWVAAGQRESLERDILQIYRLLYGIRANNEESIKVDDAILAVEKCLHRRKGRWLLVFDSADNIDDKNDAGYIDLKHYMPNTPGVDIIITTRSSEAKEMTSLLSVKVGSMELSEAVQLFSACSKCGMAENSTKIEIIVQELGCLALATTLAGSYVSKMHLDLDEYLEEYQQRRKELLNEKPRHLIHEYGESVLTTWESSFRAIYQRSLEASKLLIFLAFVHNDDILLDLFKLATKKEKTNDTESKDSRSVWQHSISPQESVDIFVIKQAFRVLESFSLVQWEDDQRSYSIHKLVHAWAYERLGLKEQKMFCQAGLELLAIAVKNWPADPGYKARLIPHLMVNFGIVSYIYRKMDSDDENVLGLIQSIEGFLDGAGRWEEICAVEMFQFKQKKNLYGDEHPSTISAMSNLAITLVQRGQLDKAARMIKEVLEKWQRILGEGHPFTISAMSNLAVTLEDQGQLEEAARMKKEVLEKRQRILGESHPDTISAMGNLANTLGSQGQLEEAVKMVKEVLEKKQRILGEDHPDTIVAMGNLAITLVQRGQLDEAARMMKEVLEKRQRILGEDHPSTISAMSNLAVTLEDQGQLEEAARMKKEVLEKSQRILGEDHPETKKAAKICILLGS